MASLPNVGDILMLSQISWKIGRAFTAGRKGAPPEFFEVESEVNSLATALKLLVEALFNDGSENGTTGAGKGVLAQADRGTRMGITTILQSCQTTLQDLDDLVQRYQDVNTYRTSGGAIIKDRGWSDVVLHNYATMMWTADGGSIGDLKDMLHVHTSTVMLTTQALQSKSLAQLERVVNPMASRIDEVHQTNPGQLSERMDELHQAILRLAGQNSPKLLAQQDGVESTISSIELDATGSNTSRAPSINQFAGQPPLPRHPFNAFNNSYHDSHARSLRVPHPTPRSISERIHDSSPTAFIDGKRFTSQQTAFSQPLAELPGSVLLDVSSNHRLSTASSDVLGWDQPSIRPDLGEDSIGSPGTQSLSLSAATHPSLAFTDRSQEIADASAEGPSRDSVYTAASPRTTVHPWQSDWTANSSANHYSASILSDRLTQMTVDVGMRARDLPPTEPSVGVLRTRSVPGPHGSVRSYIHSSRSGSTAMGEDMSYEEMEKKGIATKEQQDAFEKSAFRNSAILCDVRGTLVEYTQPLDVNVSRLDQEIAEACKSCRICLVRKRDILADSSVRLSTSIWVFSDDRKIRLQQMLEDGLEIIPYASYFTANKVSLPIPDSDLIFHPPVYGGKGEKSTKTSWINYVFESASGATHFQSLLFGRLLTHSFRTEKTLRVHEGVKGVLQYQEQLCAIELLRLWMDDETDMYGRRGVLAMIHFSGQFRAGEGYLAFWLNSSDTPVRIKDDGGKWVKIKGLKIAVERLHSDKSTAKALLGGGGVRRDSGVNGMLPTSDGEKGADGMSRRHSDSKEAKGSRWVTGAKIEFADESQKLGFLEVVKTCQQSMLTLPELAV